MIKKSFEHRFLPTVNLERIDVDGKRYYMHENGNKYASVTTVLSSMKNDGIKKWRERVGEDAADIIASKASRRGTNLHLMCENYVLNKSDYTKGQMPNTISMFHSIKKYLDKHVGVVHGIEHQMYSDKIKAAGTCDLICDFDDELCVLDYKTSTKEKKVSYINNYFLQATAYSVMVNELYPHLPQVKKIVVVIAVEDAPAQIFIRNPEDYMTEMLSVFNNFQQ